MRVGYIRVSTIDQNEGRQVEALKAYDIEKMFVEKASAKDTKRPILQEMLNFVREGDAVYIHSFDRLARSTKDLLDTVDLLKSKDVALISLKENIDTGTPTGKLMLTLIGAINEFERANLLERQREGIELAKRKGKYKGSNKKKIKDFEYHYERYKSREISKNKLAKQLRISRPTLDRMIRDHENGIVVG